MNLDLFHLLVYLGSVAFAVVEAVLDEINSKNRNIEHAISATFRVIVISGLNLYFLDGFFYPMLHTVICLFLYWITLDSVFGYRRTGDWFYIGNTAFMDRMCRKYIGVGAIPFIFSKVFFTLIFAIPLYLLSF